MRSLESIKKMNYQRKKWKHYIIRNYILNIYSIHSSLSYNAIAQEINECYGVDIIYKLQSFNNYKNAKKTNILTALDAEKQIDEIVYKTEKLLKVKYEIG